MIKTLRILSLIGVIYGFLFSLACFILLMFCTHDAMITSIDKVRTTDKHKTKAVQEYTNSYYEEDATVTYNGKEYHTTIEGESKGTLPKKGDSVIVCIGKIHWRKIMTAARARERLASNIICFVVGIMGLGASYLAEEY